MSTRLVIGMKTPVIQITHDLFGKDRKTTFVGSMSRFSHDDVHVLGVGLQCHGSLYDGVVLTHPALDYADQDGRNGFSGSWWTLDFHRGQARLRPWSEHEKMVLDGESHPVITLKPVDLAFVYIEFVIDLARATVGDAMCQCPGMPQSKSQDHYRPLRMEETVMLESARGVTEFWAGTCFDQVTHRPGAPCITLLIDGRTLPPHSRVPVWREPRQHTIRTLRDAASKAS